MQTQGGPIGVRASGTVAKVAMEKWIQALEDRLKTGGLEVFLLLKYVDDVLVVMKMVELGARWMDGKVVYKEEDRLERGNHQNRGHMEDPEDSCK